MLKSIHGLAPTYLSDTIVINADINEYNTKGAHPGNVHQPRPRIEMYKVFFIRQANRGMPNRYL